MYRPLASKLTSTLDRGSQPLYQRPIILERGKLLGVFRAFAAVRLAHCQQVLHTITPGAAQDRPGVIDEQAARRVKVDLGVQGVPELRVFLGISVVVRADQPLEVRR